MSVGGVVGEIFDVCVFTMPVDGVTWVNSSSAELVGPSEVAFKVLLPGPPSAVRYTGGATFPQCALYNKEGLPAVPFEMPAAAGPGSEVLRLAM